MVKNLLPKITLKFETDLDIIIKGYSVKENYMQAKKLKDLVKEVKGYINLAIDMLSAIRSGDACRIAEEMVKDGDKLIPKMSSFCK